VLRRIPLALLLLAGCGSTTVVDPVTPAPGAVVVSPPAPDGSAVVLSAPHVPARAGMGFVESVILAPENAAAGGTAGAPTKRIAVRMADNTLQFFDTRASGLRAGDRVEITPDGQLKHAFR
jgi:hypothetical protein